MRYYRTIIAVVPVEDADGIVRVLRRNDDILFATSIPGVTAEALAAGAHPEDWDDDEDDEDDPQLADDMTGHPDR